MKAVISSFEFLAPGRVLFPNVLLARTELNHGQFQFLVRKPRREIKYTTHFWEDRIDPPLATEKPTTGMGNVRCTARGVRETCHGFSFRERTRLNPEPQDLGKRAR